ncbi:MAG: ATP-dependent Clp protease ATP-binding subunit ClpA [Bdellovibrionales bacterium]|nr:ATP-dependent Clp protease ATP-binding subunit ClpA [Bdellovibrionales bacterium]
MIGKRAESILNRALASAVDGKHEFLTLEHVMLVLLDEPEVIQVVHHCKGSPEKLREDLRAYLQKEVPLAPKTEKGDSENPIATLGVQRLVQRAIFQVQSSGKNEIQPVDLFVAIFQAKDSWALYLLNQQGIDRLEVVGFLSHGQSANDDTGSSGASESGSTQPEGRPEKEPRASLNDVLTTYTVNLNELAKQDRLDPLVGRKSELDRVIQTLCRRRKNNPLLVGEAGVGKTAIAEGLAQRVVNGEVPAILKDAVIYSLDLGSLLAGTKFRGDFEQRMKRVIQALEVKHNKGLFPVLFIDEIHTIIGAGSVNGGTVDAANLLKPMLARGEIRCFGSTTFQEYRNAFNRDQALSRRFQKIDVPEPTQDETIQILNGLKPQFELHHGVVYTPEAIKAAVDLSVKHLTDRFLPDKAIDVIDEVGAKMRIKRTQAKESEALDPVTITDLEVEEMIAQMARIPAKTVTNNQKDRLHSLDRNLKLTIFGQDHAIEKIVSSIRLARSGLRTGDKPIGSFLFCGPTGVGKTELSKQLASHLGVAFLRFDMSEYMEQHTVSRLIGAPPGYVGFEQAGLLTDAAIKNPHSVVLLDEIEKAHPSVWNILLQVMDHGFLTDNNGKKADFRNTIIIMTSNVGSRDAERRTVGFQSDAAGASAAQKELERTFSPEFRNRLDSIVFFNPLDERMMEQVVGKQVVELEHLLLAKGVEIEMEQPVRDWLAKRGYDRKMGARPLARVIQDEIKRPLSEEILFGKLENGGAVRVVLKDDKPHFVIESKAPTTEKKAETVKG